MLTSDQKTFNAEVWEKCGVEGDHLKAQDTAMGLAAFLSFNRKGDEAPKETEESKQPKTARSVSAKSSPRKLVRMDLEEKEKMEKGKVRRGTKAVASESKWMYK